MLGTILMRQVGEVYRMGIDGGGFTLTISRAFYDHLLEELSACEDLKAKFLEIRSGLYTDIVRFEINLPFIPIPNRAHRKTDWAMLWKRAEQIGLLLEFFNFFGEDRKDLRFCLSEGPQLMAVSSGCMRGASVSGCPIEAGFHQSIVDILADEYKNDAVVSETEQLIVKFYSGMSYQTAKEKSSFERDFQKYGGLFTGTRAMIRAGGTPHFTVPGNCACLGANPDEFKWSFSMHSHNMDSPLQQLSMLAGLVSFWNDFLMPKWLEKQGEKATRCA